MAPLIGSVYGALVSIQFRHAALSDVDALVALESRCFDGDRLSRRSFKRFCQAGPHTLRVVLADGAITGYSLILLRRGTSLARLYSLALAPEQRGQGLAGRLLQDAEACASAAGSVYLRLEVRKDNDAAIALYQRSGYHRFAQVAEYYDDGCDALRFEKRLTSLVRSSARSAPDYYRQTTDFTCGPAALMMAMHALRPTTAMDRRSELQLWREATTIFMTSGHGGCSPHGLALAALRRNFRVVMYINDSGTPFIDSVRDSGKREIIQLVHDDFIDQLQSYPQALTTYHLDNATFSEALDRHDHLVALISTWSFNRNRAPHWVYIHRSDSNYVYIHDPDTEEQTGQSEAEFVHVPIAIDRFAAMASFGRRRLRCLLAIENSDSP